MYVIWFKIRGRVTGHLVIGNTTDLGIAETQIAAEGFESNLAVGQVVNGIGVLDVQADLAIHHNKNVTLDVAYHDVVNAARFEGEQIGGTD